MDIRDNAHDQLVTHVATLRFLAAQETPAQLIWAEMQRILNESALHLEHFVIPKVAPVKQHLDLLGHNPEPVIAEYVPAAGDADMAADASEQVDPPGVGTFLGNGRAK